MITVLLHGYCKENGIHDSMQAWTLCFVNGSHKLSRVNVPVHTQVFWGISNCFYWYWILDISDMFHICVQLTPPPFTHPLIIRTPPPVPHICVIIWTRAVILSIGPLATNISDILIKIENFSFTKMHLKASSVERKPFVQGEWVNSHNIYRTHECTPDYSSKCHEWNCYYYCIYSISLNFHLCMN